MKFNSKSIIVLLVLIVIVAALAWWQSGQLGQQQGPESMQQEETNSMTEESGGTSATSPAATGGEIDQFVNSLLEDAAGENAAAQQLIDADAAQVGNDSQAVSDFNQVYDANQF